MSFRQYGGTNYASKNNIVKNHYTNASNLSVMTKVGQPNSIIKFESDISGNDAFFMYVDVVGNLDVSGNTVLEGTLTVTEKTTLKNDLNVKENTVLEGTLDVTEATKLKSTLDVSGNTVLDGTLTVSNATKLKSTLDVSGNTVLDGTLDVSNATTLKSTLDVSGNTTLEGNLGVSGITTTLNNRFEVDDTGTGTAFVKITKDDMTLTDVYPPPTGNSVVTRDYVDSAVIGYGIKAACQCTTYNSNNTIGNITLSGYPPNNPPSIDGFTDFSNNFTRVLVTNQTDSVQNGIYVVNFDGDWPRSTDLSNNSIAENVFVFVQSGNLYSKTSFLQNPPGQQVIVNSEALNFSPYYKFQVSLGTNLNFNGGILDVNSDLTGITSIQFTNNTVEQVDPFLEINNISYGTTYTNASITFNKWGQITYAENGANGDPTYWKSDDSGATIYNKTISGKVGIGTTTPTYPLDISGNMRVTNSDPSNNSLNVTSGVLGPNVGDKSLISSYYTSVASDNSYINTYAYRYAVSPAWNTSASTIIQSNINGSTFSNFNIIEFNPQGYTDGIAITNFNRVGLKINSSGNAFCTGGLTLSGTTSTSNYALDITGNMNITGTINGAVLNATNAANILGGNTGNLLYQSGSGTTTFVSSGSTDQILTFNGSFPVWSNSPATPTLAAVLNAGSTANKTIDMSYNEITNVGAIYTADSTATCRIISSGGINYIESGTNSSYGTKAPLYFTSMSGVDTWMTIDSSGNVGIGKTNPNKKLDVNGTLGVSGDTSLSGKLDVSGNISLTSGIFTVSNTGTSTVTNPVVSITKADMFSNVYPPTNVNSVVTKQYVDNSVIGYGIKAACQCTTYNIGNITLSGYPPNNPPSIDGFTDFSNNVTRVLVTDQTNSVQNGIYVVNFDGVWPRSTDLSNNSIAENVFVFVQYGSLNSKTSFLQNPSGQQVTVNIGALNFSPYYQFELNLGTTLTLDNGTLNVNPDLVVDSIIFSGDDGGTSGIQKDPFLAISNISYDTNYTNASITFNKWGQITYASSGDTNYWKSNDGGSTIYNTNSGGNVGIGTGATNLSKKLTVNGNASISSTLDVSGNTALSSTLTVSDAIYVNSSSYQKRQITTSYYNIIDGVSGSDGSASIGRIYGTYNSSINTKAMIMDLSSVDNGSFIFWCKNMDTPTVTATPLTISYNLVYATVPLKVDGSDALINGLTVGKGGGSQSNNTAFGASALSSNLLGTQNTAIGYGALALNTGPNTGTTNDYNTDNTAVGVNALASNTTGYWNTAVGLSALGKNITGYNNTAIGLQAGINTSNYLGPTNCVACTFIGMNTGFTSTNNNFSYSTAIGYGAQINSDNQIMLGGSNGGNYPNVYIPGNLTVNGTITGYATTSYVTNALTGYATIASPTFTGTVTAPSFNTNSDYRIKENVVTIYDNEDFTVDNLRPVTYTNKLLGKQDMGFIAHELQEHFPFLVTGEKDGPENQSVNYIGLISLLVKEIQELKQDVKMLKMK